MPTPTVQKGQKPKRRRLHLRTHDGQEHRGRSRDLARYQVPDFVIPADGSPQLLVHWITKAALHLARRHEVLLSQPYVNALRRAKQQGFPCMPVEETSPVLACGQVVMYPPCPSVMGLLPHALSTDMDLPHLHTLKKGIGDAIFHILPEEVIGFYFPHHCMRIDFGQAQSNAVTLSIDSLQRVQLRKGAAYYAAHAPTLRTPGGDKAVAFSRPAIERICERAIGDAWLTYEGVNAAFAYLSDGVYYEPWHSDRELGLILYERCQPGRFSGNYPPAILGEEHDPKERYYYLLGYCPLVEVQDVVVATTLLFPGMRGGKGIRHTPEYDWYLRAVGRSARHRAVLAERIKRLHFDALRESRDFSLLRQFHEGGIPQVVRVRPEVYSPPKNISG